MADCIHAIEDAWCAICHPRLIRGRASWAEEVFQVIPAEDENRKVTAAEVAEATELTMQQVMQGIAYLRESHPEFPLLSSPQGYWFSLDDAEVAAFRRWRARTANTTVRRLWRGVIKPYVEKSGDPLEARLTTKQFERLLEDIEEMTA